MMNLNEKCLLKFLTNPIVFGGAEKDLQNDISEMDTYRNRKNLILEKVLRSSAIVQ